MLSSVDARMLIFISTSQLVLIAIVIYIAENSVSECEDAVTEKFVPIKFTGTLTLFSYTLTQSASHVYVLVSVFFPFNVCFTIEMNFVGGTALFGGLLENLKERLLE